MFSLSLQARGFSIEYLAKIPEVKDTVHKHSLLHHLCAIIIEQFADTTDLYSEIGALARCSRVNISPLYKCSLSIIVCYTVVKYVTKILG